MFHCFFFFFQCQLLNTEEALTASRSDLEAKSRQCHAAQMQVEKLTDELGPLRQKLTILETEMYVCET